ncbi:hypothetical protein BMF89_14980 [Arthrobacter sp. SRS-W-1-2016]|uniref:hypothetical protein n=1 Tax=Arthrobacter sp. SRS-W-1-2016 TaxID=1930254 RepID=UPI000990D36A|nr:hypothetical protein [Arthrobacter sp. SRS-W-1-2016]OOP60938.1 hypothetical protein BMF89_14980 [Arthrobacter sp. SRS-W-1-2016]
MTAAVACRTRAFLRRAGLLAGMLALIAGIFGMHIMTGSHNMPMVAAGFAAVPHEAPVMLDGLPGHTAAPGASTAAPDEVATSTSTSSCLDRTPCPAMSSMDQPCIPAPGNTSLDAPLPGTTEFVLHAGTGLAHRAPAHPYLPVSPSPGELCISRT